MKRKLIKRSKNKNSYIIKNYPWYKIKKGIIDLPNDNFTFDCNPDNAFRYSETRSTIAVPVYYSSKVLRSRIKNKLYSYRIFSSIERFNEYFSLDKKLGDIPAMSINQLTK